MQQDSCNATVRRQKTEHAGQWLPWAMIDLLFRNEIAMRILRGLTSKNWKLQGEQSRQCGGILAFFVSFANLEDGTEYV